MDSKRVRGEKEREREREKVRDREERGSESERRERETEKRKRHYTTPHPQLLLPTTYSSYHVLPLYLHTTTNYSELSITIY